MKKFMMAAAIVCAAAFAQAATYNWSMGFAASPDGESPLAGTVYAFDANQYTFKAVSAALIESVDILGNALGSKAIDGDGMAALSGSGLTDDGKSPAYASMFAIIMGDASGKQYFYGVDEFTAVKITDAVVAGDAKFLVEYVETGAIGGSGWTQAAGGSSDVPEPTSGLLMLLGMAGLALRRKQK